jgi:L-aminopeptidase/D-esterase-like protein
MRAEALASVAAVAAAGVMALGQTQASSNRTLTAVEGLKVGHFTLTERPTGCTVILAEDGAVASVDVRGGAPGTRETDLLDPVNMVQQVHAIVLSGGSAFGLDTASGAVKYLEERGIGFDVRIARVPIVPAAILFDLGFGGKPNVRPDADCGYKAAAAATTGPVQEGNVGAGAGATVGKMGGPGRSTKAGVGTSAMVMEDGLVVAALVAVNAVGDIIDPATGQVLAGVRTEDGTQFADARTIINRGELAIREHPLQNTTIGVVATNARLTKVQAQKIAQMAHDGYARAIAPAHLPDDGDVIFSMATGRWSGEVNVSRVGSLAAEAMARAIVRAATQATSLAGVPAARDLKK